MGTLLTAVGLKEGQSSLCLVNSNVCLTLQLKSYILREAICNGLDMKHPLKMHMLKAWSPAQQCSELWELNDWIMRALTPPVD